MSVHCCKGKKVHNNPEPGYASTGCMLSCYARYACCCLVTFATEAGYTHRLCDESECTAALCMLHGPLGHICCRSSTCTRQHVLYCLDVLQYCVSYIMHGTCILVSIARTSPSSPTSLALILMPNTSCLAMPCLCSSSSLSCFDPSSVSFLSNTPIDLHPNHELFKHKSLVICVQLKSAESHCIKSDGHAHTHLLYCRTFITQW